MSAAALPLALSGTASASAAPESVTVAADIGHSGAVRSGPADPNTAVSLAVALHPSDGAGLERFVADVSDPHSPQFRHFLTPAQYRERFAPSQAEVRTVQDYLTSKGLRLQDVSASRQVIDVTGTPATVHAAFGTTLGAYQQAGTAPYYAADGAAALPADVARSVTFVSGLTNRSRMRSAAVPANRGKRADGGGPNGGLTPQQLRTAYDMDSVVSDQNGGTGQTVGLLELDGFKQSDITAYTKQFGLPKLTPSVVKIDGGVSKLGDG